MDNKVRKVRRGMKWFKRWRTAKALAKQEENKRNG